MEENQQRHITLRHRQGQQLDRQPVQICLLEDYQLKLLATAICMFATALCMFVPDKYKSDSTSQCASDI